MQINLAGRNLLNLPPHGPWQVWPFGIGPRAKRILGTERLNLLDEQNWQPILVLRCSLVHELTHCHMNLIEII